MSSTSSTPRPTEASGRDISSAYPYQACREARRIHVNSDNLSRILDVCWVIMTTHIENQLGLIFDNIVKTEYSSSSTTLSTASTPDLRQHRQQRALLIFDNIVDSEYFNAGQGQFLSTKSRRRKSGP